MMVISSCAQGVGSDDWVGWSACKASLVAALTCISKAVWVISKAAWVDSIAAFSSFVPELTVTQPDRINTDMSIAISTIFLCHEMNI
jgi:hypothetical protein